MAMQSRRSSLLRQHVDGDLNDIVRQLPSSLSINAARQSANLQTSRTSTHTSFLISDSCNPTPMPLKRGMSGIGSAASRKLSGITTGNQNLTRRLSKSNGRLPTSSLAASGKRMTDGYLVGRFQSQNANRNSGVNSVSKIPTSDQKRRVQSAGRAGSMDSLAPWTPGATPRGVGFTPRMSNVFSTTMMGEGKNDPLTKNLKAPGPQERRAINEIIFNIHAYFERYCYKNLRAVKTMGSMTVVEFYDMCRFCLNMMMGPSFLGGLKVEEMGNRMFDLANVLRYPGTLSKSIFKSPTSPYQWPGAVTFLSWLTKTVENSIASPNRVQDSLALIRNPDQIASEILLESQVRLMGQQFATGDFDIETEIGHYQAQLMDLYVYDDKFELEDLQYLYNQAEQRLCARRALPDPRRDCLFSTQDNFKAIHALEDELKELLSWKEKFTGIQKFRDKVSALTTLKTQMEAKLGDLTQSVRSQKMSKAEEKAMLNEIENLKQQQDALDQVNSRMMQQAERREQQLNNLNARFYEVCMGLNISDDFNDCIQKFELMKMFINMTKIPRNPFTPVELKAWIKSVYKIKKKTHKLLLELEKFVSQRTDNANRAINEFETYEMNALKTATEFELEKDGIMRSFEQMGRQLGAEMNGLLEDITNLSDEIQDIENRKANGYEEIEQFRRKISKLTQRERSLQFELDVIGRKVEKAEEEFDLAEIYCLEEMQKRVSYYTETWKIHEIVEQPGPSLDIPALEIPMSSLSLNNESEQSQRSTQ